MVMTLRTDAVVLPPAEQIGPNTPVRLSVAAALAFPDGSITASGLRREGSRGRLQIERIAGKDYTTLAEIGRMRERCRVENNHPGFTSAPSEGTNRASSEQEPSGLSSMAASTSPQDACPAVAAHTNASSMEIGQPPYP